MSTPETYTIRVAYPDYIVRGAATTVSLPVYLAGALVEPTEAGSTFSLYDPAGNVVVAQDDVSVVDDVAT